MCLSTLKLESKSGQFWKILNSTRHKKQDESFNVLERSNHLGRLIVQFRFKSFAFPKSTHYNYHRLNEDRYTYFHQEKTRNSFDIYTRPIVRTEWTYTGGLCIIATEKDGETRRREREVERAGKRGKMREDERSPLRSIV